ncbi:MAG: MarR family transcriptional regulator [Limnohabitans sp.]|nr:MarR family transcriptional regulator [Limnohabitans sp.]
MKSRKAPEPKLLGHLEHGAMLNLLGYHLAQASIPTNSAFKKHISDVHQLNKVEFTTLMLLKENQNLTPKRLSLALNMPASNLTLLLDRIEKRKLIERNQSIDDRRVQNISLTPSGTKLTEKLKKVCNVMEDDILSHITKAEQEILFELLRKIARHR